MSCLVCLEETDDLLMFVPCLHRSICKKCACEYLKKYADTTTAKNCPVCRKKWNSISKEEPLLAPVDETDNETNDNVEIMVFGLFFSESASSNSNYKTVPCKYYNNGFCNKGESCTFIHDTNNSERNYVKNCYNKNNCKYGDRCRYKH